MESDKIWSIRDAIPGEPELDYPIYSEIPDTDFSCDGRVEGMIELTFSILNYLINHHCVSSVKEKKRIKSNLFNFY